MSPEGVSCALVDNWLLELAGRLIDPTVEHETRYYQTIGSEIAAAREELISLLRLLDLVVTCDELVYDEEWSGIWRDFDYLRPVFPLLSPVRLGPQTKQRLGRAGPFRSTLDAPDIVKNGALYYLGLSQLLGVYYWPSPQRAEFLRQNLYSQTGSGFVVGLASYIESNIADIIEEVLAPLELTEPLPLFPGFGSSILASCETRASVLPTAMQFRESKECTAFRAWLRNMDGALLSGNVRTIARALREVRDVLKSVRADLGIATQAGGKVELQIGISPSLNVDLDIARSIFGRFRPKPYHIVFLRQHLARILNNSNLWDLVELLFPEKRLWYRMARDIF